MKPTNPATSVQKPALGRLAPRASGEAGGLARAPIASSRTAGNGLDQAGQTRKLGSRFDDLF